MTSIKKKDYLKKISFIFVVLFLFGCHDNDSSDVTSSFNDLPFEGLAPIPEGERIFYIRWTLDAEGTGYRSRSTVESMRADGTQKEVLIRMRASSGNESLLHPDRKKVVVGIWNPSGIFKFPEAEFDLGFHYLWLIEGAKGIQLTGIREGNIDDSPLAWSKDGKSLYYLRRGDIRIDDPKKLPHIGPSEIWAINIDGSNPRRIIEGEHVSVSPDGNTLAIYRARPVEGKHYYYLETILTDPDGSNVRRIRGDASYCEWAQDGIELACVNLDMSVGGILLINSKGETLKKLVSGVDVVELSWSPDGQWLAYVVRDVEEGMATLWKVRVDGLSPPYSLIDDGIYIRSPQWLP